MIGNAELQNEHGSSGCAFYGQEADPVLEVDEGGMLLQTENPMPPTVPFLDLFARELRSRGMQSLRFVNIWTY